MKQHNILALNLHLFDGAAGAGASAGTGSTGANGGGGETGTLGQASQADGLDGVQYGKQDAPPAPATPAPREKGKGDKAKREAAYREMMAGDFKDLYDADINRIVGKRFKASKGLQAQLDAHSPILEAMATRYDTPVGDIAALQAAVDKDNSIWAEKAEQAGMSVEAFKKMEALKKQMAQKEAAEQTALQQTQRDKQVKAWLAEAETLKPTYPDFDLRAELRNDRFSRMVHAGFPLKDAYEAAHMAEIMEASTQSAVKQTQKAVVANIQARGNRPKEAGISAQAGMITKSDPRSFTKEDRKEIRKRVSRGDKIKL